jgi:tripartite-type tricarboxylate transporter receptor subunit TctC
MFDSIASAQPHVKSGALKALAVTGPTRSPLVPEVPTLVELGYPRMDQSIWWGLLLPAKTPADIVTRYNTELVRILDSQEFKARMAAQGWESMAGTPAQFTQHIANEVPVWTEVVRRLNLATE